MYHWAEQIEREGSVVPKVHRSAIVPYTKAQMYDLVNDIESYKAFVPWCVNSVVHERDDTHVRATLTFSAKGVQKSFTTINRLQPHGRMDLELVEGPFKKLSGVWQFVEKADGHSEVMLDLEYELAGGIVAMMFGSFFTQIASSLVAAFVQRAETIYAKQVTS